MSVHHVMLPSQVFSLYPLSFTMNHLHIQFMKPAGSVVAGSLRFQGDIYSMASQPGKTTRPANTMMHHSSIEEGRDERGMLRWLGCSTIFLLSMTSDILPFSVSKRMCTTGVNRVNTHVVHLDGSSLIIKMRHGYERGCLTLRARRK